MRVLRWIPVARDGRAWTAASLAAVAIMLATVMPALAAKTPLRLADAAVTPRSATEGETVTFRVTYRNLDAVAATSVLVEFDGASYPLSPVKSRKNVVAGIRYEATVTPAAGSGGVRFVATDLRGRSVSLAAGSLTVAAVSAPSAPPSSPAPSSPAPSAPPSTPPPSTPPPSAAPPSAAPGTAPPSGSPGSPAPSAPPSSVSPGGPSASPSLDPGAAGGTGDSRGSGGTEGRGGTGDSSGSGGTEGPGGSGVPGPDSSTASGDISRADLGPAKTGSATRAPDGPVTANTGARALGRSGSGDADPAIGAGAAGVVALGAVPDPVAAVLPVVVTSLGGATMLLAFMMFGKRRRDGEPTDSDMALATAAATGSGAVASAALVDALHPRPAGPVTTPLDAELAMPRWRRPSLLEARKADPLRTAAAPAPSLSFDRGAVDPVAGRERRRIRYRVVRLLDSPDELTALDVGVLDAGDEVQLLERSGVYWFVLCPDGQQGWVHKMVLGEVVEEPESVPGPAARATGLRPEGEEALAARLATAEGPAADGAGDGSELVGHDATMTPAAWTLRGSAATDAGLDVDDDVMRAFLAAQRRA